MSQLIALYFEHLCLLIDKGAPPPHAVQLSFSSYSGLRGWLEPSPAVIEQQQAVYTPWKDHIHT